MNSIHYQIKSHSAGRECFTVEPCEGTTGLSIVFHLNEHQAKFLNLGRYLLNNGPRRLYDEISIYDFLDAGSATHYANGETKDHPPAVGETVTQLKEACAAAGAAAYADELPLTANPWGRNSTYWQRWQTGWKDAQQAEAQQANDNAAP